jgi:NADH-quinone oxidoreductase subunit L
MAYYWLIPLLPLLGAVVNGTITLVYSAREKEDPRRLVSVIGCGLPIISFLLAVHAFFTLKGMDPASRALVVEGARWISVGGFSVDFSLFIDPLSSVMILVVTGIGSLIHVYSMGYMGHDEGYARYFSYLNLFLFSMLMLVLGKNLLLLFLGWEGVGLCSYLLIGFWYTDSVKAYCGRKAFVVNRIGDFGFLIGLFLIFWTAMQSGHGTLDVPALRESVTSQPALWTGVATAACLLLFVGATGKSAQIPLYVWLPDAMAGPTPVSALIHAATMVTAGVYMIARLNFLYVLSPVALTVVAVVGAATALLAATIGVLQNDIKKVLAYSTVSQLGYMFLGVGVAAFSAGIFHLMTHAFFKACLFLGSGAVIHALHEEQDIRNMGGLFEKLRWTATTFIVATLAIAGVPLFAGFFSKDEILWKAFSNPNAVAPWLPRVLWIVGVVAAILTAFYMTRLVILTFFGKSRVPAEKAAKVHEAPFSMVMPLVVLAAGSILAGYVGLPEVFAPRNAFTTWLEPSLGPHGAGVHAGSVEPGHALDEAPPGLEIETEAGRAATYELAQSGSESSGDAAHPAVEEPAAGNEDRGGEAAHEMEEHHASAGLEFGLMGVSVAAALLGIWLAYLLYLRRPELAPALAERRKKLYELVYNKYYVDEFYQKTVVDPTVSLSRRFLFGVIDRIVIDGTVNAIGVLARVFSALARLFQTGYVRSYLFWLIVGLIAVVLKLVFR